MQKSNLSYVAEGKIPYYSVVNIKGKLTQISKVFRIYWDYGSSQIVSQVIYSMGMETISKKWILGIPKIDIPWNNLTFKTNNGYIIKKICDMIDL